ncbi:MAG: class III signal peptide-containing protein [Candidatus Diapherotrites archaeon]|uniref:Class III signal peptide-containing protein n=1 Tax=Candidatus Iainarchaeum sp. TaxID=3101447 RepID=A0A7J4IYB3_9ARCH|nr:MAG: hypothetical protein QT03_C0001G1006 [archaeon GW2011_AR10]MBS3058809.1 class III signal peptide-containing protein [Candidatus Diapherotrites archaeon]HIH07946.1 class III signal peptide-containing protein [Candidatus Diapherotrites archaeon]
MLHRKGQGTTEYLIILAVIIVIALIVVGVLGWIPGVGTGITQSQSQAYWASTSPFAMTQYEVFSDGSTAPIIVLRNQTSNKLTLTDIRLTSTSLATTDTEFTGGSEKSAVNATAIDCGNSTDPYSYDVNISYSRTVGGSTLNLTQVGIRPLVGVCT